VKRLLFLCLALAGAHAVGAAPCDGIDRSFPDATKRAYLPAVERHLNAQLGRSLGATIKLEVPDLMERLHLGRWHIVYVNDHVTDEPYLFYDQPPTLSRGYRFLWAGAAADDEGPAIVEWLKQQAPDMPAALAQCFASHVTLGRASAGSAAPASAAADDILERGDLCLHLSGEFNGDQSERDKELNAQMIELHCERITDDLKALKSRSLTATQATRLRELLDAF
jgi:hypothetical protein